MVIRLHDYMIARLYDITITTTTYYTYIYIRLYDIPRLPPSRSDTCHCVCFPGKHLPMAGPDHQPFIPLHPGDPYHPKNFPPAGVISDEESEPEEDIGYLPAGWLRPDEVPEDEPWDDEQWEEIPDYESDPEEEPQEAPPTDDEDDLGQVGHAAGTDSETEEEDHYGGADSDADSTHSAIQDPSVPPPYPHMFYLPMSMDHHQDTMHPLSL